MRRFLLVLVLVGLGAGAARAQTPEAEARNEEGKELFKDKAYGDAARKFREAYRLSPDPRFAFNLCAALEKTGDLDGALEACDAVFSSPTADAELKSKAGSRAAAIRKRQRDEAPIGGGGQPTPVGGPPPGGGSLPPPPPGGGGGGLQPGVFGGPGGGDGGGQPERRWTATQEEFRLGDYKWSFGAEAGVMTVHSADSFDSVSFGSFRGFVDRTLRPDGTFAARTFLDVFRASDSGVSGGWGIGEGFYLNFGSQLKFSLFASLELAYVNETQVTAAAGGAALGLRLGERLYLTFTAAGQSVSGGDVSGSGAMVLFGFEYRLTTRPTSGGMLE